MITGYIKVGFGARLEPSSMNRKRLTKFVRDLYREFNEVHCEQRLEALDRAVDAETEGIYLGLSVRNRYSHRVVYRAWIERGVAQRNWFCEIELPQAVLDANHYILIYFGTRVYCQQPWLTYLDKTYKCWGNSARQPTRSELKRVPSTYWRHNTTYITMDARSFRPLVRFTIDVHDER
ncbi:CUN052 hypothetical protein [Culex nigripalpus nucleopolyhedrovirus]|uniref:Uncharacterized protein n=1 Tax=Culex nigripalpus nucleopolyhedrovirus (isolate Florida/1997) TaxID=645993 RepID=Q919M5_NPVCO|nr:CUN052 hypothetical protein [Culex nigripalpus nucleopolyhedrovirus]AAK94130.1 CUN052 hypothetical protein [Culex nigripalpus nucleopolyhedrovirus]